MANNNNSKKSGNKIGRRMFIGGTGAGLFLGYRSCTSEFDFNERDDFPKVPENNVNLPKNGKSVLILGGGFGGMHAACELLDRGFEVTILEKTSMLGGKLKSWRDKTFGVPPVNDPNWKGYPHDHGAHAVWGFYNNLREFMGRHNIGLWKGPKDMTMYNFLDRDGTMSTIPNISGTSLFSIRDRIKSIFHFGSLSSEEKKAVVPALIKMLSFNMENEKERLYLDSMSVPEYARSLGVPERVIYRFFAPIAEMAMFDHADNTSALYFLMLLQLTTSHPDDMDIDIFLHPPGETYVDPVEKYINDKGGKIIYDTPVTSINQKGGRITSVTAGEAGIESPPGVKTWKCRVCGSVFASPSKPSRCPVCGAPAIKIKLFSGGEIKDYSADFYILAMETNAAKEVIKTSSLPREPYFDNIQNLHSTSVYVINLWYPDAAPMRKLLPGQVCFFPSNFKYLGITLDWAYPRYRKGHGPIVPDYQGKNISVIETQIANTDRLVNLPDEEIMKIAQGELEIAIPGLPKPLDFYLNRWDTYSPQRPGYEANRPTVESPIDNFFIIGDWVRTNHLGVYMEKTNVSAKMATNLIMEKIGMPKYKVRIMPSGSPSLALDLNRFFSSPTP
jgi:uncharacterized protein with NAD-binding domain and iron-sulfur cluster